MLTDDERAQLVSWSRRAKSARSLALRSRIVLACADGQDNKQVAAWLGCSPVTVGKWRTRFIELRLDGLADDPRPGRPASITAEQVEDVVGFSRGSWTSGSRVWSRRTSTTTNVTGGLPLAEATGAAYHINAADRLAFGRRPIRDVAIVEVSPALRGRAIATRGHTYTAVR